MSNWPPRLRSSLVLVAAGLLAAVRVGAAETVVSVTDEKGRPVPGAVVTFTPAGGAPRPAPEVVEIVQKDLRFTPGLTIIPVGSRVKFPNRDDVAHHVYSFSDAKKFDIPLYSGEAPDDVVFDRAGVVTLGCNIHDWMVAHIFVTATPFTAVTGDNGRAVLRRLPPGPGTVGVWHPRLRGEPAALEVSAGQPVPPVVLRLRPDFRRRQAPAAGGDPGAYR